MTANSQYLAQLISTSAYLNTLAPSSFKTEAIRATQAAILANIQSHSEGPSVDPVVPVVPANFHANAVAALTDDVCSICQLSISMQQTTTRTPCNHLFHHNCLTPWMSNRQNPLCPLCRSRLSEEFVQNVDRFDEENAIRSLHEDLGND